MLNQRNLNIDLLRIVAIFSIILIHSSSSFLIYNSFNNGAHWWIISVNYSSFLKWATGVFVMISGAFLLEEKKSENISHFLRHRIVRIIIPFLVWAIFYKILENPAEFVQSRGSVFLSYLKEIYRGQVEYHLWFIYMLSILYLMTPVLSFLVNHAPKRVLYYFICIWLLLNFIPNYLSQFLGWNFGSEYYLEFSKYSGLFVLGYLLKGIKIPKPWLLLIPFAILASINAYGTYYLSNYKGYNDYFFLSRLNITNILNSVLIYLFFISIKIKEDSSFRLKRNQFIIKLSLLSYGIFLNHVFILNILRSGKYGFLICSHSILGIDINPYFGSIILFIFTSIGSTILAYLLSKIPFIKRITN